MIDDLEVRGCTAIYKAIRDACEMLEPWSLSHPNADRRVLCLSDGNNNCHEVQPQAALASLARAGAVCDCLIVGNNCDTELLRLVHATGGKCFTIASISEGFETLESRGVLSLKARREGEPRPPSKPLELIMTDYNTGQTATNVQSNQLNFEIILMRERSHEIHIILEIIITRTIRNRDMN